MATAKMGTWWRTVKLGPGLERLAGVASTGTSWIFVGYDGGSPRIYKVGAQDFESVSPSFVAKSASGSSILFDCDHLSAEGIVTAVGVNGRVETSVDDGDTWIGSNPTSNEMRGIVAVSGDAVSRLIAVGRDEIIGQDSGGVWSTRWTGTALWLRVAHMSGVGWVAVNSAGQGIHSVTGANGTWSTPYTIHSATLNGIGANATRFITVGDSGGIYYSTTGLSGSWTQITAFTSDQLHAVWPMATAGNWVAFSRFGEIWFSEDNGDTWSKRDYEITDQMRNAGVFADANRAGACGWNGGIYVSYDDTQIDPDTVVEAQTADPAFGANSDMAGDAVRRLVTQFRS